jgi:hypothetical protein
MQFSRYVPDQAPLKRPDGSCTEDPRHAGEAGLVRGPSKLSSMPSAQFSSGHEPTTRLSQ